MPEADKQQATKEEAKGEASPEQQEEKPVEIDWSDLIRRLVQVNTPHKGLTQVLSSGEILYTCQKAEQLFKAQPSLIEIDPPVRICGDVHGQYADLLRLFNKGGFPPMSNYLFLGDYVDRGKQNMETILLLLAYKLRYPKNFFLLRGNHECWNTNKMYGFFDECARRYHPRVWLYFQYVFYVMPLAAVVGDRILCMHGGLSPELNDLQQLRDLPRVIELPAQNTIAMDLLWADPSSGVNDFEPNPRGTSVGFSEQAVLRKCDAMNIDLVVRAHQVVQDGYEFFAGRRLVTLFSAPHYCGQFDNAAAIMVVDSKMRCSFEILRPKFGNSKSMKGAGEKK